MSEQAVVEPKRGPGRPPKADKDEAVVKDVETVEAPRKVKFRCTGHNNIYVWKPQEVGQDPVTGKTIITKASRSFQFNNGLLILDSAADAECIEWIRGNKKLYGKSIIEINDGAIVDDRKKRAKFMAYLNSLDTNDLLGFLDEAELESLHLTRQADKYELIDGILALGKYASL